MTNGARVRLKEYISDTTTIDNFSILKHLNFTTENDGINYTSINFGENWNDCFDGKYKIAINDLKKISPQEVWEEVKSRSSKKSDYEYPLSCSDGSSTSCQLRCPTCRHGVITYKEYGGMQEAWDWISSLLNDPRLKGFTIGCHGEAFYNKYRTDYLKNIDQEVVDSKDRISIITNGLNITPKMCQSMNALVLKKNREVVDIRISLDAATKETYALTRPTANWDKVIKNIIYLVDKEIGKVAIDFTIQTLNFEEMIKFSELASSLGCGAIFRPIYNWFWEDIRYKEAAIWKASHPQFPEFLPLFKEAMNYKGARALYQLKDLLESYP